MAVQLAMAGKNRILGKKKKKTTCSYMEAVMAENEVVRQKKKIMEEKIMPGLRQEAEKRTWDFLQNLVEQRKAPDFADSALKKAISLQAEFPDFSFRIHQKHSMYYYFVDYADRPYSLLFVNRVKENGKRVVQLREAYTYAITVKEDQEYLKLKEKLETSDEMKFDYSYDYDFDAKYELAKEIAKQQNFEDLTENDVTACFHEVLYAKKLSKSFDETREFCFLLLDNKNVQEELEASEEDFIYKMKQKYKLCDSFQNLSYLIRFVDRIAQQRRKRKRSITNEFMPEPDAREMIDACLEAEKNMRLTSTNYRSVYIKLKLAVAEEIGLITKNEQTGYYEETYGDFFDKTVEELLLEYGD